MVAVETRAGRDAPAPAHPAPEWTYRPHLDGLRTIAVYLVVAFHAGADRFAGGFIGVDVFFVLSGFLVTQILLRDLYGFGRVGLSRFYSRRFRRLLPASFVMLAVTAVVYSAIASPSEMLDALDAIRASFLYVANWFFVHEASDYFADDINASPVVHFWSLAIEEQFYVAWPLLLTGLFVATRRAGRHRWNVIRAVVALGALLSVVAALRLSGSELDRAYYGTDTRAYQLLAGALLALSPSVLVASNRLRRGLALVAGAAIAALALLATALDGLDPIERGAATVAVTVALIVAIESPHGGPVKWALSLPPVTYLGRISYGTYLWHWPVIVVAARGFDPSPASMFAISALVATALASLSFQLLERPVRSASLLDRYRGAVIAGGLAASLAGALVVAPAVLDRDDGGATVAEGTAVETGTRVPADLDWEGARRDRPDFPDCYEAPVEDCVVVRGSGPTVAVMGDSHARMWLPGFEELARERGWTLAATLRPVCAWQDDLYYAEEDTEPCRVRKADWTERVLPAIDPDVVIVVNRQLDDPQDPVDLVGPDGLVTAGTPAYEATLGTTTRATVARLRADGRRVVIIEPTPGANFDPLECLSSARYLDECRYVANVQPTRSERLFRAVADEDGGVWSLDLDRLVCPYLPICDPLIDGLIVKRDAGHLTQSYARTLSDDIAGVLDAEAILAE